MTPRISILACLAALLLAGVPAVAAEKTVVFVHETSSQGDRVFVYQVNEKKKCRLTRVAGSPFVAASTTSPLAINFDALTVAYSKRDAMLFTASQQGINAWKVPENLRLRRVAGSPFGGGVINHVTVVTKGADTWVYGAAGYPDRGLRGFRLQSDGSLVEIAGSPFETTGGRFTGITVVDDLLVVIKAGEFFIIDGEITTFRVQADGTLTAGPRFAYDLDAIHPYLARGGSCAFFPEINRRRLLAFGVDAATGVMTAAAGSPFPVDSALMAGVAGMAISNDLALLFDSRPPSGQGMLRAFTVNADCTLTPRGGVQSLGASSPIVGTITPRRTCFVMASPTEIRTFRLNAATGALAKGYAMKIPAQNLNGIVVGTR